MNVPTFHYETNGARSLREVAATSLPDRFREVLPESAREDCPWRLVANPCARYGVSYSRVNAVAMNNATSTPAPGPSSHADVSPARSLPSRPKEVRPLEAPAEMTCQRPHFTTTPSFFRRVPRGCPRDRSCKRWVPWGCDWVAGPADYPMRHWGTPRPEPPGHACPGELAYYEGEDERLILERP